VIRIVEIALEPNIFGSSDPGAAIGDKQAGHNAAANSPLTPADKPCST
jgi:hypothetical protein